MSVSVERSQLVDLARTVYDGKLEIEDHLKKCLAKKPIAGFFSKVEEKLWMMLTKEHPWKDFTCGKESLARANILKKICRVLKSKFLKISHIRIQAIFR